MNEILQFWPSLALLCLSAIPASYMHLKDQGKVRYPSNAGFYSFFGEFQHLRKYKKDPSFKSNEWELAPNTWYYRFFKIKYKEAFPFSATFLVNLTDAYHASQALMRILMSLSITLAIGATWWSFLLIWGAYATIHMVFYKLLSR